MQEAQRRQSAAAIVLHVPSPSFRNNCAMTEEQFRSMNNGPTRARSPHTELSVQWHCVTLPRPTEFAITYAHFLYLASLSEN